MNSELHRIGRYELDVRMLRLYYVSNGRRTEVRRLSFREACILDMLITAEEEVVDNQRILNEIWGDNSFYNLNSLYVFMARLKHYLALDDSLIIQNIRGKGYRLIRK